MAEAAAILSNAEMKLAEELDDVKKMNQMMAYAKVVTIRDAQINEKKVMEKERMQEERRLDEIMEIERLKAVKMYDEREQKRMRDAVEGRQVITEQIREREAERVRQLERQDQASAAAAAAAPPRPTHPLPLSLLPLLSTLPSPLQEREAMLRQLEEMRAEEVAEARAKIAAGAKLSEEVAQISNALAQIALNPPSMQGKHDEQAENARIAAYNREKDRREQAYNHEQEAIKQAKEREIARCAFATRLGHRAPHNTQQPHGSLAHPAPLPSAGCARSRSG